MARSKKAKPVDPGAEMAPYLPSDPTQSGGGETTGRFVIIFKDDVETAKV